MRFKLIKAILLACTCTIFTNYALATTTQPTTSVKHKHIKPKVKPHKKATKKVVIQKKSKKHIVKKVYPTAQQNLVKKSAQYSTLNTLDKHLIDNKLISPDIVKNTTDNKPNIKQPRLYSYSALVLDAKTGEILVSKNPDESLPIASITKLMMAMVVLDSGVDMNGYVTISNDDIDDLRNTFSRLKVGVQFKRRDLMLLALMSSENRAAAALARTTFNGGTAQFVSKMNEKARSLLMSNTKFYDPTGLVTANEASASDLTKMVKAAYGYDVIRSDTTTKAADVSLGRNYVHRYMNSDSLVRGDNMQIELSKTGFINESGHCLALYTVIDGREVVMVFLNSAGKSGRVVDAIAVKNYVLKL